MFEENKAQFFDTDSGFAVVATFTRAGAAVATADVIFNDPSAAVDLNGTDVEEQQAFLLATTEAVADVRRKDAVSVNGAAYVVERIHPDGTGMKLLYLAES
jgi:hypothetical protein